MNLSIRRSLSVLAMTLLLTGTLAACGTESQKVEPTVTRVDVAGAPPTRTPTVPGGETPPPSGGAASPAPGGGEQPVVAATTVEIDMVDLAFQPTELTIPANTDVTIKAVNKGALPHTFTIPDVADTGEVPGGSSAEVKVNLPAGDYTFDCSIPGHKDAGMVGTLKVVEGGGQAQAQASPQPAGSPSEGAAAGLPTSLEIDMVDLAFQPTELTIPANTDVTINAVNKGALPHTFTIPDVADTGEVPSGESKSVTVNLPPGEYTFDCSVPGHKEAGMVGTLKVVEGGGQAAAQASPQAPSGAASPQAAASPSEGAAPALPTSLEIDMVDLAFQPTELTIPANTDVTIKAVNKGALPHTFTIPDVADTGEVASGSSAEVKVNLPAGEYAFECTEPGHKDAGMVGTLKVVEGGGAAAGAATPAPATQPEASPAQATPAAAGTPSAGGGATLPTSLEIDMVDLAFEPTDLTIPANTDVTIKAVNKGALPHTFTITGVADTGEVAAGSSAEVKVNLPAGTYQFDCVVPGHKEAGMVGTLAVVESGGATPAASPAASPQASPIATEVNLDMVELRFIPDTLEIPANVDVQVNLSNSGNLPHNFSIKDQDVSVDLAAGDKTSFTLNLPPGTYDFFCNVPGHESAGMVGKLTVVEGGGTPVASPAGQSSEAVATSVEVDMVDLAFQPTGITIAANTDVTIKAVNKGALPHTFTVPDVADTGEVASGESKTITVNLPPGEYDFDCAVPGHKEAGMVGKLIVK